MSDNEEGNGLPERPPPFSVEYDKRGTAKCKVCKVAFNKGELRMGKTQANPFAPGFMKAWHHVSCLFNSFRKARATTKKVDDVEEDIENWDKIEEDDQQKVLDAMKEYQKFCKDKGIPCTTTPKKEKTKQTSASTPAPPPKENPDKKETKNTPSDPSDEKYTQKDNSFREFRRLCASIAENSSYLAKTEEVQKFFTKGTGGDKFRGDLELWIKLLLPGVVKRVYNLQSKQLIKVFSQVFNTNLEEMQEHLEGGDVAETVREFFEKSRGVEPAKKSQLSIQIVDGWLKKLEGMTKEEEQISHLSSVARQCTGNDLKMVVRLIKGDLRINAGAKHILGGVHPDAYEAFQTTRNIEDVVKQIKNKQRDGEHLAGSLNIKARVLTPVLPMLAQACKSVEQAFKQCPNGMYSEIKYDGERVQLHKTGSEFKYFSRSLKPVQNHKVTHFAQYIPEAFPHGHDLILDAEVLLVDTKTGNPLPFGTLGVHKKSEFSDASVCLFVFDCIHYNGENLMKKPLCERRQILRSNMTEVKNHVQFSEMEEIHKPHDLRVMIAKVLSEGLEGLVLKDIKSIYEPGKRHWLKVKKDYLAEGAMADSADLVVLGAYYGTGKKGGMMSVFLMGCYNPAINKWCTVSKVHTGLDDATLESLQSSLSMEKISGDYSLLPPWLKCSRGLVPDFVAKDPKDSPVWEITGAEFTQNEIHSAEGISIRFPRVTKRRLDKNWETATDLNQLKELFKSSKDKDFSDILGVSAAAGNKTVKDKPVEDEDTKGMKSESNSEEHSPNDKKKKELKRKHTEEGGGKKEDVLKEEEEEDGEPKKKKRKESDKEERKSEHSKDKKKYDDRSDKDKKKSRKEDDSGSKTTEKCRYGAGCYNTSALHKARFYHPPEHHKYTVNPLPDVFTEMRVFFEGPVDKQELLTRYIIAYGGQVLPSYRSQEATHRCVAATAQQGDASSCSAALVTPAALWSKVMEQH